MHIRGFYVPNGPVGPHNSVVKLISFFNPIWQGCARIRIKYLSGSSLTVAFRSLISKTIHLTKICNSQKMENGEIQAAGPIDLFLRTVFL